MVIHSFNNQGENIKKKDSSVLRQLVLFYWHKRQNGAGKINLLSVLLVMADDYIYYVTKLNYIMYVFAKIMEDRLEYILKNFFS